MDELLRITVTALFALRRILTVLALAAFAPSGLVHAGLVLQPGSLLVLNSVGASSELRDYSFDGQLLGTLPLIPPSGWGVTLGPAMVGGIPYVVMHQGVVDGVAPVDLESGQVGMPFEHIGISSITSAPDAASLFVLSTCLPCNVVENLSTSGMQLDRIALTNSRNYVAAIASGPSSLFGLDAIAGSYQLQLAEWSYDGTLVSHFGQPISAEDRASLAYDSAGAGALWVARFSPLEGTSLDKFDLSGNLLQSTLLPGVTVNGLYVINSVPEPSSLALTSFAVILVVITLGVSGERCHLGMGRPMQRSGSSQKPPAVA